MVVGLLMLASALLGIGRPPVSHGTLAGGLTEAVPTGAQPRHTQGAPSASLAASSCQYAGGPIYANGTGEVFVICAATGNIAVISTSNDTVIASIPIGPGLWGASGVYDPDKQEIFLSDTNNAVGENVSVISVRTDTIIATIDVGSNPGPLLYDPGASEIFVEAADGVVVISDTNNSVVATIHAGYGADGLAFDPSAGAVFIAYSGSNLVAAISDRTYAVLARIPVGTSPGDMSYGDGYVAVVNSGSDDVTVISPNDDQVAATIPVETSPSFITFDSGMSEFFVSNFYSSTVSVIDLAGLAVAATIQTFPYPTGMNYVAASGTIYLQNFPGLGSNAGGYNLTVISDKTDRVTGIIPVEDRVYGVAYDPQANELFVPTLSAPAVGPCGYAFVYSVNVVSTETNSTVASIPVGRSPAYYCVTFDETGFDFVGGAEWCFNSTQSPGLTTCSTAPGGLRFDDLPNGTYTYSIWSTQQGQSPVTPTVIFTIRGVPVTLNLTFVAASSVTFTATGLPSGVSWSVAIDGSVTLANGSRSGPFQLTSTSTAGSQSIVISLPNGTYNYSASSSGFGSVQGSANVSGLQPMLITVAFSPTGEPLLLGLPIVVWVLVVSIAVGTLTAVLAGRGRKRGSSGMA
jgi:YVTN family beta-propeller protein